MGLSLLVECEQCGDIFTDKGLTRHKQVKHQATTTTKTAIVIDLIRLRELMADFILEVSPDDPTAYSVPFETFLRWLQRKKQERER